MKGNAINININAGDIVHINSIKVPWFIYLWAIGDFLAKIIFYNCYYHSWYSK